ncbi:hypothetical protein [Halostella litorea]|uniref:hypothetical protein n=1 Tax=Halostella litorea TaxID=2528831 RepID=UPI001092B616|nr:hypothetical protein [Halostella litorea]
MADGAASVSWQRVPPSALAEPLVVETPLVEVKLEHPGLLAARLGEGFFPDAVPYVADGEPRTVYWRGALPAAGPPPSAWDGVCATTHGLRALAGGTDGLPPLAGDADGGTELVVDGTVGGDSTAAVVRDYDPPAVGVASVGPDAVGVTTPAGRVTVPAGDRKRVELSDRTVATADGDRREVTPRLTVRFPGRRTLYHPDRGAGYALFPSFGLDLDAVSNPVEVPTTAGELDDGALAAALGVDLDARPYPERVLWQAFAHAAFDPHRDGEARIAAVDARLVAVGNPP